MPFDMESYQARAYQDPAYSENFQKFLDNCDFPEVYQVPLSPEEQDRVDTWDFGVHQFIDGDVTYIVLEGA